METIKRTNHINTSEINFELIQNTVEKIEGFVYKNEYQYKDKDGYPQINETNINLGLINLSKKKRKKLGAYIYMLNSNVTLEKANKFFHFLMKIVLNSDLRLRIVKSDKELAIQEKRKAYKATLKELLESPLYAKLLDARAAYKIEKGDFYKSRVLNNQTR